MLTAALVSAALFPAVTDPCDCDHALHIKPLCLLRTEPRVPALSEDLTVITPAQAREIIENRGEPARVVRSSNRGQAGVTFQFTVFGTTNAENINALQLAADYVSSIITDPVSVNIDVYFGVTNLGGTAPSFIDVDYSEWRNSMRQDADPDDALVDALPRGNIRVQRTLDGPEERSRTITLTTANAKALGIPVTEGVMDAQMFVGSLPDGDPTDGIGNGAGAGPLSEFSLVDILVHEIGHAIGFFSTTDYGLPNPSALDVFRFQRAGRGNPETLDDFRGFPRALWRADPSPEAEQSFDFIDRAHFASNGTTSQSSHFEETGAFPDRIGVMESSLAPFETGYPDYFSQADRDAFDAIGWDITAPAGPAPCNPSDLADPRGVLDLQDIVAFVTAFNANDPAADLDQPAGVYDLADVVAFVTEFSAGCP